MASIHSNQLFQKIRSVHQKHPWIRLYFVTLFTLLAWGVITTTFLPIVEANSQLPDELSYEQIAPGWASQKVVRAVLEPWQRWDANFYLEIAKLGYSVEGLALAFPPFYPLLVRLLGKLLGGQFLLASLLISWSAVFGACYLLEERFTQQTDQKTAVRGIRNLLFFPTAFFIFSGYTTGLFLFLVLLAWRSADREEWLMAGLLGGVATLTRFLGIFLVLPFGLIWLKNWQKNKIYSLLVVGLIPTAYFGWGLFTSWFFHISPSDALNLGWALHFDWPWKGLLGSLDLIFFEPVSEVFFAYIDVLAVMVTFFSIFWWMKKKAIPELLFMIGLMIISLMKISDSGILGSTSRYLLPLFPNYLMLAELGKKAKYDRLILVISIFLWLFSAAMFFTWNWIA